jgi:hypothetical protein
MSRLRLRIHVAEPWNFDRYNPTSELIGWTVDHQDADNEDWLVHLDEHFTWEDKSFSTVIVTTRYLGERLARIIDSLATISVDIGRRIDGAWRYDMAGILAFQHGED